MKSFFNIGLAIHLAEAIGVNIYLNAKFKPQCKTIRRHTCYWCSIWLFNTQAQTSTQVFYFHLIARDAVFFKTLQNFYEVKQLTTFEWYVVCVFIAHAYNIQSYCYWLAISNEWFATRKVAQQHTKSQARSDGFATSYSPSQWCGGCNMIRLHMEVSMCEYTYLNLFCNSKQVVYTIFYSIVGGDLMNSSKCPY